MNKRWLTPLTLSLALVLVAGACGSDKKSASTTATTATTAASTATTAASGGATTTAASTATTAASGGSTPAATGEPLVFGLANMDTGAVSFPGAGAGAQAAAKHINDDLGGIQGRPLQLVPCDMKNEPQAAATCGQQFANDSKMVGSLLTLVVNGGPFYDALKSSGKPVLGAYGISPADNAPANTYFYYAGAVFYPALYEWIKAQPDIKTIAYFHGPDAASQGGADALKALMGSAYTVREQIVAPGTADLTPAVSAADVGTADLVIAFATGSGAPLAQAMKDLGAKPKKVVTVSSVVTAEVLAKSPDLFTDWIVANPSKVAVADPNDPDTKTLLDAIGGESKLLPFLEPGWGITMTLYNVLKDLPSDQLTSAGILKAITDFKGPVVMGPETLSCPGAAPTSATCTKGLVFYHVKAGGKLEQVKG